MECCSSTFGFFSSTSVGYCIFAANVVVILVCATVCTASIRTRTYIVSYTAKAQCAHRVRFAPCHAAAIISFSLRSVFSMHSMDVDKTPSQERDNRASYDRGQVLALAPTTSTIPSAMATCNYFSAQILHLNGRSANL